MRIVLIDALRGDRVKALALSRKIGQPGTALEIGEEPKRQDADEQPCDPPGKGSVQDVSC